MRGHPNKNRGVAVKWTPDLVEEMRELGQTCTVKQLAEHFQVSTNAVRRVLTVNNISAVSVNTTKRTRFYGCDEDCFNCTYRDCYRPGHMIHEKGDIVNDYATA